MPDKNVLFVSQKTGFVLRRITELRSWLNAVAANEKCTIGEITYIFTTDKAVLEINKQHLQHDYYTDVITFDYSVTEKRKRIVSGDIFISIDRVTDNANIEQETFKRELGRVMVHGLLHLCGYRDKTKKDELAMRKLEDFYLTLPEHKKRNA
jgi:probable rRNA maturation factor